MFDRSSSSTRRAFDIPLSFRYGFISHTVLLNKEIFLIHVLQFKI